MLRRDDLIVFIIFVVICLDSSIERLALTIVSTVVCVAIIGSLGRFMLLFLELADSTSRDTCVSNQHSTLMGPMQESRVDIYIYIYYR